jgi:hypothetical protein
MITLNYSKVNSKSQLFLLLYWCCYGVAKLLSMEIQMQKELERIKALYGLNIRQLAAKIGISYMAIHRTLNGHRPNHKNRAAIVKYLANTIAYIDMSLGQEAPLLIANEQSTYLSHDVYVHV